MHDSSRHAGFTLTEVLVALLLLATIAIGIAHLVSMAMLSLARARTDMVAVELARSRLDELLSLPWGYGAAHEPLARLDASTDLSFREPGAGGSGLFAPSGTLDANTPSFVDHLDAGGRWMGRDVGPPSGARFTRRWFVSPVTGRPDLLLVAVSVIDLRRELAPVVVATLRMRTSG
ncbi:MAG: prepilin-type N-terminal cleavage/methylation domain-containing protein [Acidobacteriota bacterium]|jgi:prepilin-type N-terminal cleavage/methylation domain-containing protein|nr:MAG: hypothetical protein DIU54_13840 [Acidobacteriota bacterium]